MGDGGARSFGYGEVAYGLRAHAMVACFDGTEVVAPFRDPGCVAAVARATLALVKVGFNKTMGGIMVGLGAVCALLGLIVVATMPHADTSTYGTVVSGGLGIIVGVAWLTRTQFEVTHDAVVLCAPIGPMKRRFPFTSRSDVRIVDSQLRVGDKKVAKRWVSDTSDWEKLRAYLRGP